jgi:O-antigen/teichoic acid export membrane protein
MMEHAPGPAPARDPESDPGPRRPAPTLMDRLWHGTFWLGLKMPVQIVIAFWSIPLVQHAIGVKNNDAYVFAWGFGFLQFLLEFGMSSALQRQLARAWVRDDRAEINRLIAGGMSFYAVMALLQVVILLGIAYLGLPARFQGETRRLVIGLLWIQAISAPFFGVMTVVASVLQAARRYELLPRLDLAVLMIRFAILYAGLRAEVSFVAILAAQVATQVSLTLLPALWVMVRELGYVPHFWGARRDDYAALLRVGFYIFLMQLSVTLADKLDVIVLGYALPPSASDAGITVYQNVSKPFLQIRQMGWTLAYLVMPAVATLAAAHDLRGLERLKYDGSRQLIALLLPVILLAAIYAAPFLDLWVGARYAPYAWLMRLFLVATLPLGLSVLSQMAIGLGRVELLSLAPLAGALVNLPLSFYLTTRLGVSGVIWGTVLTTLISNLLVPGVYLFRLLAIRPAVFAVRTLGPPAAGAGVLLATAWVVRALLPPDPIGTSFAQRAGPFLVNLTACCAAYAAGYLATPLGRRDLSDSLRRLRGRRACADRPGEPADGRTREAVGSQDEAQSRE